MIRLLSLSLFFLIAADDNKDTPRDLLLLLFGIPISAILRFARFVENGEIFRLGIPDSTPLALPPRQSRRTPKSSPPLEGVGPAVHVEASRVVRGLR